jgi:hypothetical protein
MLTLHLTPNEHCDDSVGPINGQLYLSGGWDGSNYVSAVQKYSVEDDAWTNIAPMPGLWSFILPFPLATNQLLTSITCPQFVVAAADAATAVSQCPLYQRTTLPAPSLRRWQEHIRYWWPK